MDARLWLRKAFSAQKSSPLVFRNLKSQASFGDLQNVAKLVGHDAHPFHRIFFGTTNPRAFSNIRWGVLPYAMDSIEREMQWASLAIHNFAAQLNFLLRSKESFETALVRGDLKESRSILAQIERDHGFSLWGLHSRIVVEELEGGLESSARFVSSITSDVGISGSIKVFAHFLKMRAEAGVSTENYRLRLERYLQKTYEDNPGAQAYLRFKLGVEEFLQPEFLSDILFFEQNAAVVDRYISFVRIAQSLYSQEKRPEWLSRVVRYGLQSIEDQSTTGLLLGLDPTYSKWTATAACKGVVKTIDLYTAGDYAASARDATALLESHPLFFDLYEIKIKSLIYSKSSLAVSESSKVTSDVLLRTVDAIFRKVPGHSDHLETLRKITFILDGSILSAGLRQLYMRERGPWTLSVSADAQIDSPFLSPRAIFLLEEGKARADAISNLRVLFPGSATLDFTEALANGIQTAAAPVFPTTIDEARSLFYMGRVYGVKGKYQEALEYFKILQESLVAKGGIAYPLLDHFLPFLFECLVNAGKLSEAAELFVSYALDNLLLTRHLDVERLAGAIEQAADPNLDGGINTPIAYALFSNDSRRIYVAYDNFLSNYGVQTPIQLLSLEKPFESKKLIYFLRRVCVPEVMISSPHFQGTDQLQKERIALCQKLALLDPGNSNAYSVEIDKLTQIMMTRAVVKRIEESKIYVDEKGIRKSGSKIMRENFQRFKGYASLNLAQLKMMDISRISVLSPGEGGVEKRDAVKADLTGDKGIAVMAHYVVFKEMFIDLRDRFIASNEYGLDCYLSTRIRHGTLQGQIRNTFERLNLITQYDSSSRCYIRNSVWDARLSNLPKESLDAIQNLLAKFSEEIDSITNNLKDVVLHVKVSDKKPGGLFDFTFDEHQLLNIFARRFYGAREYEVVITEMFKILWERTNENLLRVRDHIEKDLNVRVFERLTVLHSALKEAAKDSDIPELLASVVKCRTDIQHDFDKLKSWFYVAGSSYPDEISARDLLVVCIKSSNNIHSQSIIEPAISADTTIRFKGSLLPHFSDIFRTLFENIIKHSDVPAEEYKVSIDLSRKENQLEIAVENQISPKVRASDPVKALEARKVAMVAGERGDAIRTEGGTGYPKIWKTLQVDLGRKSADMRFEYSQENNFKAVISMELEGLTV